MKVPVGLPSKWMDALPVYTLHVMTITVLLIALTFIFSGMMHSQASNREQQGNVSSSITPAGRQYLNDLSEKASKIAKDAEFMNRSETSILRIGSHRFSCPAVNNGNCSCYGGAYSFAEIEEVETRLLKPGKKDGRQSISRVNSETCQGLENIRMVFGNTSSAADTLETVVSIGDVAPGQDRGTGNSWFGIRGSFSNTFAYWRRVMTAAFDLIAKMSEAMNVLFQKLCASDARVADLEAQNQSLLKQLQMKSAECNGHAQRCRQAEQDAELAALEGERQLKQQAEEHKKKAGELWIQYTFDLAKAKQVLQEENAAHQQALQAAAARNVSCSPHSASREQAAAAKLQAVEARYVAERNAMRAVQLLIRDSLRAVRGCSSGRHSGSWRRRAGACEPNETGSKTASWRNGNTLAGERKRTYRCWEW